MGCSNEKFLVARNVIFDEINYLVLRSEIRLEKFEFDKSNEVEINIYSRLENKCSRKYDN